MKHLVIGVGIWGLLATAWAQPEGEPAAAEPEDVPRAQPVEPVQPEPEAKVLTSRSKQFRISGGNELGRGLCVILTEDAKEEFLRLLEQRDDWKIPVSVVLYGEPGDKPPKTSFLTKHMVVEGIHQLHLYMHLAEGLKVEEFKRMVTEMLLYERSVRALPQVDESQVLTIPPWLSVGLREAVAWRRQQSDRRLYAAMFKQGGAYKVEDLLAVERAEFHNMDEASRVAFRVSAGSLVMALLEQPQGREAFRKFLDEAAAFEGEMPLLLRRHFPELNLSPNSLKKWWALQMANQGGLNLLTDVMSIADTEEQLAKALYLELPTLPEAQPSKPRRISIDQWQQLSELKDQERAAAVRPAQAALVHLSYRCFPAYRPLLIEYQKQFIRMAQGDDKGMDQSLMELSQARQIMMAKSQRGRDYMDWFEITRANKTSGVFDDYLRLKRELKERGNDRKDGVSLYLDQMDKLFDRSETK